MHNIIEISIINNFYRSIASKKIYYLPTKTPNRPWTRKNSVFPIRFFSQND